MPYDTPHIARPTATELPVRPLIRDFASCRTAPTAAAEVAPHGTREMRPIEPMLLLHQEQARTLRLIGAAVRRGLNALIG